MPKDAPFELSSFIRVVKNKHLNRCILSPLEYILGYKKLSKLYQEVNNQTSFIPTLLNRLNINYEVDSQTTNFSKTKPLIIVSNHPFGAIEALILLDYFSHYRSDLRVMANIFLKRISSISDQLIGVNPFKNSYAKKMNHRGMKDIYKWLDASHCLITFPAGNVSHIRLKMKTISDPDWDQQIAKLARTTNADVLPVYIEGKNSLWFYCLGPNLQALRYGNELLNKENKTITIRIGDLITTEQIESFNSDSDLINHFRRKSDALKP